MYRAYISVKQCTQRLDRLTLEKRPLGRLRIRWVDNIKLDIRDIMIVGG
jgi:hypothetical protein